MVVGTPQASGEPAAAHGTARGYSLRRISAGRVRAADSLWSIAVAFILAAASYAALGLLVGVLVRGDLEGFFLIIMTALLDTFLENPVDNPLANKPILEFFPSYGPIQFAAAGAFHHQVLPDMVAVSSPGRLDPPCSAWWCSGCACRTALRPPWPVSRPDGQPGHGPPAPEQFGAQGQPG